MNADSLKHGEFVPYLPVLRHSGPSIQPGSRGGPSTAVRCASRRRLADVDGVDGSVVTELSTDANPFTALIDTEGPLGAGIQNLLELTGIQQDLLDPVLGLVGSLGGLLTS
jgi:hypothetical protein